MVIIEESRTIQQYKKTMQDIFLMYIPQMDKNTMNDILDYSINKRYKPEKCVVTNSYKNTIKNSSLLGMADYIIEREPIVTASGTMFARHGTVPNPLADVIQGFLDQRAKDKAKMYEFPKGSEGFEKYNLFQLLDKISCNGIYGILGMITCLIFNLDVAMSVTSQGQSLISSATMMLEQFLANNVKFGSLNEVLIFINNVSKEKRITNTFEVINNHKTAEEVFVKVAGTCGYRWIPTDEELDVIWQVIQNLNQEQLDRVYYKNNLYEFCNNDYPTNMIKDILLTLDKPFFNSLKPPKEIKGKLEDLAYLLKEYVYYDKMIIDRIDRCANMIKSVVCVSDTDSVIISLDAWYRYVYDTVKDLPLKLHRFDPLNVLDFVVDEESENIDIDDVILDALEPMGVDEHYDFINDEIIEAKHMIDPFTILPEDWLRYSIINIMAYVIDVLINDYMEKYCMANHSMFPDKPCKLILKNEFTFTRVLMTSVKKSYASLQAVQEGHIVPESEQLDVKGIASMAKSSMSKNTRKQLKKILYEDILKADTIDQFKIIEQLAIFEKKILNTIRSGSKEYFKPVVIKSINNYENPMRIQGIKASTVWNELRTGDLPYIDLDERNAVDIAKINLNKKNIDTLEDKYPEVYEKAMILLQDPNFKGSIESVAIPKDTKTPDWIMDLVDYNEIINNNIGGFPYASVGIVQLSKHSNYSNILQL